MSEEPPTPSTKPLGMPIGSVRALLALLLVGAVVIGYLYSVLTGSSRPTDDQMVNLALVALAFYFAGKGTEDKPS